VITYDFYAGDHDSDWGEGTVCLVYSCDSEPDFLEIDQQFKAQFLGWA
jgi:hypothetical protein